MEAEAIYIESEHWCQQEIKRGSDLFFDPKLFRATLRTKSREWCFPQESLHSLVRNLHLYHVKVKARHIQRNVHSYVQEYASGCSIVTMAKRENYSPYMLSRYIVEQVAQLPDGKKGLTRSMRDPLDVIGHVNALKSEYRESELQRPHCKIDGISTTRLAMEVKEALDSDPLYGPTHDRWRHTVGIEYEVVLEDMLQTLDIPFESESQLRDKGSARTPDVLLQCPIGVQVGSEWKVVCWIDSKALFGDVGTHKTSVLPQAESYVHRFGPGMILYWFGHAPLSMLGDANGDIVIQGWNLPQQFLWPTGEIGHWPDNLRPSNGIDEETTHRM